MNAPSFEPVMSAMLAALQSAAVIDFTADGTATSAVLANVSSFAGLFPGLPVFGPGLARGITIASLNSGARTVTLSSPATVTGVGEAFTTGFLTTGRRVKHWSQVTEQPALFFRRIGTSDGYSGRLQITTLECEVWIYSRAGEDADAIPDVALSNLDQMIRSAFVPTAIDDGYFTLNRLVDWARIEGRSDYSPGDQGGQGISRIPVRITLQPN